MVHGRCHGGCHIYGIYRIQWDCSSQFGQLKLINPGAGDINYEWHFPSAGYYLFLTYTILALFLVRIPHQKTSHPPEKHGRAGQLFHGPDAHGEERR